MMETPTVDFESGWYRVLCRITAVGLQRGTPQRSFARGSLVFRCARHHRWCAGAVRRAGELYRKVPGEAFRRTCYS